MVFLPVDSVGLFKKTNLGDFRYEKNGYIFNLQQSRKPTTSLGLKHSKNNSVFLFAQLFTND